MNLLRQQRREIPSNKAKKKLFQNNKFRSQNMGYSNEVNKQQTPHKKKEFEKKKAFNPRQILNSDDRWHKCGDSKHIEGFQCSVCKYQYRNCHKCGHFSSLCYKKNMTLTRRGLDHPKHISSKWVQFNSICGH